ncbi:T9SS type A sorting domain-containing protein [Chryseobacterium sp. MMS23-Vi53]|uniref:T9SS type A sorting domain-containing protein n=1 Tax=Chryseobacterium sp. MMS23-Vi53 TaxID=3386644 RepID=UPI0039E982C0
MKKKSTFLLLLLVGIFYKSQNFSWTQIKYFGENYVNYAYKTIKTNDNSLLSLSWHRPSNMGNNRALLTKWDLTGNLLWKKLVDYGQSYTPVSIIQTQDNNFVILGYGTVTEEFSKGNEAILIKVDQSGNLIWRKNYGGTSAEKMFDIVELQDGSIVAAGQTNSNNDDVPAHTFGGANAWIFKTDASGILVWSKVFGGYTNKPDYIQAIKVTDDGNIAAFGSTASYDGDFLNLLPNGNGVEQFFLFKLQNDTGDPIWKKAYNIPNSRYNFAKSMTKTSDGGFALAGSNEILAVSNSTGANYRVVKTDGNGNLLWDKTYIGSNDDEPTSIIQTDDGNYIVAGQSQTTNFTDPSPNEGWVDIWIIGLDGTGEKRWGRMIGGNSNDYAGYNDSLLKMGNNNFILTGSTVSENGTINVPYSNMGVAGMLLFFNAQTLSTGEQKVANNFIKIYPNPSSDFVHLKLNSKQKIEKIELSDVSGKSISHPKMSESGSIDISGLPAGVYFLNINSEGKNYQEKIIKK